VDRMAVIGFRTCLVFEYDGFRTVDDHAPIEMPGDGPGKDAALDFATLANQILHRVVVADALHVLLDDRPLIEIGGHVMGGGPDQLHAPRKGLMIRFCSLKPGRNE